jgi:ATP-dependent Clp protease protease subunit
MLAEVKESIINAYEIKTSQSRAKLSHLMDAETWMNANKAIELGFADGILTDYKTPEAASPPTNYAFSRRAVTNSLLDKLNPKENPEPEEPKGIAITAAIERLNLISGGNSNV